MPKTAICFHSLLFQQGQRQLLKDMKLVPSRAAASFHQASVLFEDRKPPAAMATLAGVSSSAASTSHASQVEALFRRELPPAATMGKNPSHLPPAAAAGTTSASAAAGAATLEYTRGASMMLTKRELLIQFFFS